MYWRAPNESPNENCQCALHSDGRPGRFASFVARARTRAFRHLSELLQSANPTARHSVSGRSEDGLHDIYIGHEC